VNIVMVAPFGLSPKGTVKVRALPLAKALGARGHQVTLLIPPWDDPASSGMEWVEGPVRVVNAKLPPRIPILFHLLLSFRLVHRVLMLRPRVVHFFKPKAFAGLTHFFLWWMRRLGIVSSGVVFVVDEDDWERAWNDLADYSVIEKGFFAWQEIWGLRHADRISVASQALVEMVQEEGVPARKIHYLPNGWWRDSLADRPTRADAVRMLWELDSTQNVLLFTRFVEFRLSRIARIVELLAETSAHAKLLIVGEGLRGEEAELDEMLDQAGLSKHTVFTGWVPSNQIQNYFAAVDVAIFPYDDTLVNRTKCSVRLIDMMAAGVPVVADAVGQNKEYIRDNESGILVPAEDDSAMAAAAIRVLEDGGLRSRLSAGASARIRDHFAWARLAQVAERAYVEGLATEDVNE
jgi:glycosyltransferase involved in cell wall biosynthesis